MGGYEKQGQTHRLYEREGDVRSSTGFVIGDICYILGDGLYHNFWGDECGYEDGIFQTVEGGLRFGVGSTAYGDGLYYDDAGREYPVDAGVIGIVPLELAGKDAFQTCCTVVYCTGDAHFRHEGGVFDIGLPTGEKIHINTRDEDDGH